MKRGSAEVHSEKNEGEGFAASVNRDIIRECEKIGIPLEEFADLCLRAMQARAEELQ